jgi:transposase
MKAVDDRDAWQCGAGRSVNWALHMIAVTQTCGVGPGQAYVEGLLAGKTRTEALRLLRRRLSAMVFCALLADAHRQVGPAAPSVAQAA